MNPEDVQMVSTMHFTHLIMPYLPRFAATLIAFALLLVLPGCEAIGAIFEAGVWVGVVLVIVVLGAVAFLVSKMRG